jgi:putative transposase
VAAHQKKARDLHATLGFTDESGFLMAPLVKRSLAPIGVTPLLEHRARHRDKVSAAAALLLSPTRGHVRLVYQTFPNTYVDVALYGFFLRHVVLHAVRGPLLLVHDNGSMHHGDPLRALCHDVVRLDLNVLPPYAPELNPVEYLWNWCKDKELANFAPHDVPELDAAACHCLEMASHNQQRLRSFFESSPLPVPPSVRRRFDSPLHPRHANRPMLVIEGHNPLAPGSGQEAIPRYWPCT